MRSQREVLRSQKEEHFRSPFLGERSTSLFTVWAAQSYSQIHKFQRTRPVYTGDPGDAPGYVTGVSHNSPSIAKCVLRTLSIEPSFHLTHTHHSIPHKNQSNSSEYRPFHSSKRRTPRIRLRGQEICEAGTAVERRAARRRGPSVNAAAWTLPRQLIKRCALRGRPPVSPPPCCCPGPDPLLLAPTLRSPAPPRASHPDPASRALTPRGERRRRRHNSAPSCAHLLVACTCVAQMSLVMPDANDPLATGDGDALPPVWHALERDRQPAALSMPSCLDVAHNLLSLLAVHPRSAGFLGGARGRRRANRASAPAVDRRTADRPAAGASCHPAWT